MTDRDQSERATLWESFSSPPSVQAGSEVASPKMYEYDEDDKDEGDEDDEDGEDVKKKCMGKNQTED